MDNIFKQNLLASANHLDQELALNPTEEYIEKLLNPLDIDDIVINPTGACPIHFSYNYNNVDFTYGQNLAQSEGKLQASIRAFHNKPKAYLSVGSSVLSISSDSDISITNPRSQGCPRFQSGEELANSVGKINTC